MTATSVKDVSMLMGSMAASQATNSKNQVQSGFGELLDKQQNADDANLQTDNSRDVSNGAKVTKTPNDSLKARDDHELRTSQDTKAAKDVKEDAPEEIDDEKLVEAMEAINSAGSQMVNEIAEAMGVEPEEVLDAMQELGMKGQDLLNPANLGELVLNLADAESSYDLVTDENLYESYQSVMGTLDETLENLADELGISEDALQGILDAEKESENAGVDLQLQPQDEMPKAGDDGLRNSEASILPERNTILAQNAKEGETSGEAFDTDAGAKEPSTKVESKAENVRNDNAQTFSQNLQMDEVSTEMQTTASESASSTSQTQEIMDQILDYMRLQLRDNTSEIEMQLHPASLGTVQVQVASKGGEVTANFITQNEAVRAALESQMIQLQQQFEAQGIKVNAIEVTVQTHQFEQNLEQGREGSNSGGEPERRPRTRRINLNDLFGAEEVELEPEDRLAADMLAAGGGTVDYTA